MLFLILRVKTEELMVKHFNNKTLVDAEINLLREEMLALNTSLDSNNEKVDETVIVDDAPLNDTGKKVTTNKETDQRNSGNVEILNF